MLGSGMSKVIPGLYVGNYRDSKDIVQLGQHGITHILAIHDTARRLFSNREYLLIAASDVPSQNLAQYFQDCNDFIHSARLKGGQVLVHCLAGMSRSVTVAVAYLMSITNLGWRESLQAVRGARPVANPNAGFQKQLQDYEVSKLAEERRRMAEKYGAEGRGRTQEDESFCRRLILTYRKVSKYGISSEMYWNKQRVMTERKPRNSLQALTKSPKRLRGTLKQRTLSVTSLPSDLPSSQSSESARLVQKKLQSKPQSLTCITRLPGSPERTRRDTLRRSSEPSVSPAATRGRLARSATLPILCLSKICLHCPEGGMKGSSTCSLPSLGSYPRALPEITHAYESEDGLDPLGTEPDSASGLLRISLARSCVAHLSQFSTNHIARISRSLKSLRVIGRGVLKNNQF